MLETAKASKLLQIRYRWKKKCCVALRRESSGRPTRGGRRAGANSGSARRAGTGRERAVRARASHRLPTPPSLCRKRPRDPREPGFSLHKQRSREPHFGPPLAPFLLNALFRNRALPCLCSTATPLILYIILAASDLLAEATPVVFAFPGSHGEVNIDSFHS